MNNLNLKHIAENLLDTFFEAGKIATQISQRGVKITIKDGLRETKNTDKLFESLMGKKPEQRYKFILENANFTTNLDYW